MLSSSRSPHCSKVRCLQRGEPTRTMKFRWFAIVMEYGLLGGLLCYAVKINRDYFSQTTMLVKYCRELHNALSLSPQTEVDETLVVAESALKAAGKRPRDKHISGSDAGHCICPECSFEVAFTYIRRAISRHTDILNAEPLEKELTVAKSRDKSDSGRLACVKGDLERERRKSKSPSNQTVYAAFEIQKRHENVLFRCGTTVSPVRCKSSDSFHALLWMLYRRGGSRPSLRANTHFYRLQTSLLEKPDSSIAPLDMSSSLRDLQSNFKDTGDIDHPIRIQVLQDREAESHIWVKHQATEFSPELPLLHFGNIWTLERNPTSLILKDIGGYLWNASRSPPGISLTDQYYEEWTRFLPEMLKSKELDRVFWLPPIATIDPFQPSSDSDSDSDSDDEAATSSQATLVELPGSPAPSDVSTKQLATFAPPADAHLSKIETPVAITMPSVAANFSVVSCLQKEDSFNPQKTDSNPYHESEIAIGDTTPDLVMAQGRGNKLSTSIETLSDSTEVGFVVIQQQGVKPLTSTGVSAGNNPAIDSVVNLAVTKPAQFVPDSIEEFQKQEKGQRGKKSWLHQGIQWVTNKLKR